MKQGEEKSESELLEALDRKVVVIPEHNTLTHKWCNRCERVVDQNNFYKSCSTKDGLYSNCKECKKDQKRKYLEKKRQKVN